MSRDSHETTPLWRDQHLAFPLPSLTADTMADVCVIGAGITGLTAAYLLAKEGKNVVLLDARDLAAGESARTTAHITGILDDRYFEMISAFGERKTQIIAESHMAAINRIEAIIREENIDCDFEHCDGYLVAMAPEQAEDIKTEAAAALTAGFADRSVLSAVPINGIAAQGPALRFPHQALFHPLKYAKGLAEAFIARGGRILTHARVVDIRDGVPVAITTENGHKVHAAAAIVATYTPINDLVTIHTKQAAYRSYAIACEIPKAGMPPFLLWDMDQPYHYVRLMRDGDRDYVIVGGEDHKTGQGDDRKDPYAALEAWTRRYLPVAGAVARRWSGQIMEPVDRLAFIGRNPGDKNIYIATGFSGNGMTYATIAGLLIRDLIDNRDNHWADIYDPARKSLTAAPEYLRENANAVAAMVGDWVSRSEVADAADIPPGEGAVMRDGLSKVAAYRDEEGDLHICSAVCTHLGCIVQWNSGEKTWDCPCHGSRYSTEGEVLNGPAVKGLASRNREEAGIEAPVTEPRLGGPFPAGPIITGDKGL